MKLFWQWSVFFFGLFPFKIRKKLVRLLSTRMLNAYADISVAGQENLKAVEDQRVIFVANHLSNADAIVIRHVLQGREPVFLAGVKLQEEKNSKLMLETFDTIIINPEQADRKALTEAVRVLKNERSVLVFPEGTRSRDGSMIHGKKGVLLLARFSKALIVPIGLEGTEKLVPISETSIDREFFQKAKVKVKFGKPFTLPKIKSKDKKNLEEETLRFIMCKIACLLSPEYKGVYSECHD